MKYIVSNLGSGVVGKCYHAVEGFLERGLRIARVIFGDGG